MTIAQLNAAGAGAFMEAVGFTFEDSPWIARAACERRPFSNLAQLHRAMMTVVREAPQERRIALIAAHPDLAGRVAREGRLTAASRREQTAAGLERLSAGQIALFDSLNTAYRDRFGFPFVICAREHTPSSILEELKRRTHNEREIEIETALGEIAKIARLRLEEAVIDE